MKLSIRLKLTLLSVFITLVVAYLISVVAIKTPTDLLERSSKMTVLKFAQHLIDTLYIQLGWTSALLVVISTGVALVLSTSIYKDIKKVKSGLEMMEQGLLPEQIQVNSKDEIGQIAQKVNVIASHLKETAEFVHGIGEGKYDSSFTPLSDQDLLRNSLINMTKALSEAEVRENERAWVIRNIAEAGNILRSGNTLEVIADSILKFLVDKSGAVQGALYVADKNEFEEDILGLISAYAYNRKKYIDQKIRFGEGLTGQAAFERGAILRTEIPDDYCTITSGILGDQKPVCIFICPLILDEKVFGVVELAGLRKFTKNELQLLEECGPIIARTIFNIQVSENTQRHLEESRRMSGELQVQQEELRQNAEEMKATQEELQKTNEKLEVQIEEVNRAQRRTQTLLENASEVIIIFDSQMKIKYVSPSVEAILGYASSKLIGEQGSFRICEEDVEGFTNAFHSLLEDPASQVIIQIRFSLPTNELIWLEVSGRNKLEDPSVSGLVFNYRDITLKRKAEIEERMRRNMQALSENSPDLITRLSIQGGIIYINPVIEIYTGKKTAEFINRELDEFNTEDRLIASWKEILEVVKSEKCKHSRELGYDTSLGKRIMQVNAIPEYNDGDLETVLIVSHDITEQKLIEMEVKEKNKNISESINYSKRIQNAIVPDTKLIQTVFSDSFIFYKPKDVVSGDFPWFKMHGDIAFIAAVDCTGHGVPGAMLSLVGYFQLNNIIESNPSLDPGKILDLLDEKVNSTLIKASSDENIKDGMDIALCKIDKKYRRLEYAGAHRPLYHLTPEGVQEYKGNRWAIGGGTYRNQSTFTSYSIELKKGESVYFFSDGFPDQFGGNENRKLGTSRIKDLLDSNRKLSMDKMEKLFEKEFDAWKGEHKQTDDVLLIGIKF